MGANTVEVFNGFKMTELCLLPEGWGVEKLGNLGSIITGNTPKTAIKEYYNGDIPFISPADLGDKKYIYDGINKLSALGFEQTRKFPPNSVMVTCIGELGKVGISKRELATNQQINTVICKNEIVDYEYFYYTISLFKYQMELVAGLQVVPIVNKSTFSNLFIPLPPLPEQHRIAEILSAADETIERTGALIAKYRQIKAGLMTDLLTSGIDEAGRIRSEETHEFKDSPLGRVPEGWEVERVIELLNSNIIKGIQDGNHGELYPRLSDFSTVGRPFISAKHVDENGTVQFDFAPKLPEDYCSKLRVGFGKAGDVILAHNATVGRIGIAALGVADFMVSTSTTYYRTNLNKLDNYYLFHFLRSETYQKQLVGVMAQTTRNQVPITMQKQLFMILPPLSEQRRIAEILTAADDRIEKEEAYRDKLLQIKKGLMQDLLTGKVRVSTGAEA